ncbi:hypothetical protein [Micromonospora sp. NBC_01813]|uniref:hypothetical protein n=1 Tax=Micromonospora sp. NBC_01813 TaxID=2975988 RepID=UPI002DD7C33E|nr:hypothetical protein [Micromonospora sp. NBC_01813]WSA06331.1 hypothetical protein OG958_18585 [Micromonospora sp. NBC_01813]
MASDIERTDPYRIISEFWGDELDRGLLERIVEAPRDHLDEFRKFYYLGSDLSRMPTLPSGNLRPIIRTNPIDVFGPFDPIVSLTRYATVALLYAHEVIMDDPGLYLAIGDRETRESVGQWLVSVRPLFAEGALHFKPVTSASVHPSAGVVRDFSPILESAAIAGNLEYFKQLGSWPYIRELPGPERGRVLRSATIGFLEDIYSFSFFARLWQNQVHRMLRSEAERLLLQKVIEGVHPGVDRRHAVLFQLANLYVPSFSPDINALVAVRQQEGAFGDFRHNLAKALRCISLSEASEPHEMVEARRVISAELAPDMEQLQKVANRSPALAALKTGVTGFGVSVVSAAAGYMAGGSLVAALASAGVTKAIDVGMKYRESAMQIERDRAMKELVVSLQSVPLS